MRYRAADVAAAVAGSLDGPDVGLDGVSFDSRTLHPGQLFVPLVADRDGHAFLADAVAAGAPAFLTQGPTVPGASPIMVADTTRALLDLGRWGRDRFPDRVIGITGSVGKTSVKDLTAAVVRTRWVTAASDKSLNNDWGLPATIVNAPDGTEALVLEMGMRGFGEIARLCTVGRPTVGVVTKVAAAHTERVGNIEGVARAKAELVEALPAEGWAVLNADDEWVVKMAAITPARVLTFGATAGDVRVEHLRLDDEARARFRLATPWGSVEVVLAVPGAHMAVNAAAAAAAGLVIDVALDALGPALAGARLSPWRMEMHRSRSGGLVLNDAYNANPASMRAAVATLAALAVPRRVAVLGVMAEIDDAEAEHLALAAELAAAGIELIAVGTAMYGVAPVDDPVAVVGSVGRGDAVLVKGSRVAGLERVALRLVER